MGLKSQALLGGSYRIFSFVTFLFVLIVLFLFVLLFKTIQKHVQKGPGGSKKQVWEGSGELLGVSGGGLEPRLGSKGIQIRFLMILVCLWGLILGAFGMIFLIFSMLFCKWLWICVFLLLPVALGIKN